MRVTTVSVGLEKRASDGDFGSELAKVELRAELELGDDPMVCLAALQAQARGRVERDLGESRNLHVRRGLIRQLRLCNRCGDALPDEVTSYLHPACREAEDAEREARYQQAKAKEDGEQWAMSNANAEERALLVGAAVGDDDDEDDVPL